MIHPEDLPGVIKAFSGAIATGSRYDFPMRLRRRDGVYRWFQHRVFRFAIETGKLLGGTY